jgi:hypothetical protein
MSMDSRQLDKILSQQHTPLHTTYIHTTHTNTPDHSIQLASLDGNEQQMGANNHLPTLDTPSSVEKRFGRHVEVQQAVLYKTFFLRNLRILSNTREVKYVNRSRIDASLNNPHNKLSTSRVREF